MKNRQFHLSLLMAQVRLSSLLLIMMMMCPAKMWAQSTFSGSGAGTQSNPYKIATAAQLNDLRAVVNAGNATYNAAYYQLTADIENLGTWTPIGTKDNPFKGTFDGQGHSITGMSILKYTTGCQGLFGKTNGATVKDFSIGGEMTSSASSSSGSVENIGGAIGWAYNSTVEDVTSNVNITLDAGTKQSRVGGVLGDLDCSVITGCTYTGTLDAGATSCVAGIAAYTTSNQNVNKKPAISNCHNAGTVKTTATSPYIAGILGYQNTTAFVGACNCLNTGSISAGEGATNIGAIYGYYGQKTSDSNNNYYKTGTATKAVGTDNGGNTIECTSVTAEQLASGEVCYLLNGKTSDGNLAWYQTIGTDNIPVLDNTHEVVYKVGKNYINPYNVTASTAGYPNQDAGKAFDFSTGTKWCCKNESGTNIYVEFNTSNAMKVGSYTFTTCGDTNIYPERNPKIWVLKGKVNATDAWTTIDTQTNSNKMPATNITAVTFDLDEVTATAYKYFRIDFTHKKGCTFQLSEISLSSATRKNVTLNESKLRTALKAINTACGEDKTFTLTFAKSYSGSADGTSVGANDGEINLYNDGNGNVVVAPTAEGFTIMAPAGSPTLFYELNKLSAVTFTNFNTSNVTNMRNMFYGCTSLTSLDLTGFNTSNVTDMRYMFYNCQKLTTLDLTGWNTLSVTNMQQMFSGCSSLTSLDLSSFNTSRVTDMVYMFCGCSSLTSLDLTGFNTGKVTNMQLMFYDCSNLTALDLSSFNTSNVTNMNRMFWGCSRLTTIVVGDAWSPATYGAGMFNGCSNLKGQKGTTYIAGNDNADYACVDGVNGQPGYLTNNKVKLDASALKTELAKINTACHEKGTTLTLTFAYSYSGSATGTSVGADINLYNDGNGTVVVAPNIENFTIMAPADCSALFQNLFCLASIDFTNFNTSRVTNTSCMFDQCNSLTSLDLTGWNTLSVTNMQQMFSGCSNLTSLNMSSFNTSNVTNMQQMFSGCYSLTSLNVSSFSTANVTNMSSMFNGCESLTSLNLTGFNTSNVTNMSGMFVGCISLTTIFVGDDWSTAKVTSSKDMFYNCTNLVGQKGTTYNSMWVDAQYARLDGVDGYYAYLSSNKLTLDKTKLQEILATINKACGENETFTLTFANSYSGSAEGTPVGTGIKLYNDDSGNVVVAPNKENVTIMAPADCKNLFSSLINLSTVTFTNFNTENVTDMSNMFEDCSSLTSLDLSSFNTSNVTDMNYMFEDCSSLTSLDLSSFNTSDVTDMSYMFEDCSSLTSLDLSSFNTLKVTDMSSMFECCSSLTTLDLSSFNPSSVTDMKKMFRLCSSLTTLDVSSFNTSDVTDMSSMFLYCSSLTTLDLSSFNTSSVREMTDMFWDCSSLTSLDLSSFNTLKVMDMSSMFYGCQKLTSLDLSSFNTSGVTNMGHMFTSCYRLTTIFVGDAWSVAKYDSQMFMNCMNLVGQNGTKYSTEHLEGTYARLDTPENPGYLSYKEELDASALKNALATINSGYNTKGTSFTLTFAKSYSGSAKGTSVGTDINLYNDGNGNVVVAPTSACNVIMAPADCKNLFKDLTKLSAVIFTNFNTEDVTNMGGMFQNCSSLTSFNLTGFKTSNVTDMNRMFCFCSGLTSLDLTGINTSGVTNMEYMFYSCKKLTTLDLRKFSTSSVTSMNYMFYGCSDLSTIFGRDDWAVTASSNSMFYGCSNLVGQNGTKYNSSNTNGTYARLDTEENPGYFSRENVTLDASALKTELAKINTDCVKNGKTFTLTFTYSYSGSATGTSLGSGVKLYNEGNGTFVAAPAKEGYAIMAPADCSGLFEDVTKLTTLDLRNFNTENVTDMSNMFESCEKLTTIYVGDVWSTAKVTSSSVMFQRCSNLMGQNYTTYNTNHIDCTYARVDTPANPGYFSHKVTIDKTALKNALATINTDCEATFTLTFEYSHSGSATGTVVGTGINLYNNGNDSIVVAPTAANDVIMAPADCSGLFKDITKLSSIDFHNFNTGDVANMSEMFNGCSSLTTIYEDDGWSTANVTKSDNMFNGCTNIVGLNGTTYDADHIDCTYARLDVKGTPGYFSRNRLILNEKTFRSVLSSIDNSYSGQGYKLTFANSYSGEAQGTSVGIGITLYNDGNGKVVVAPDKEGFAIMAPADCDDMFSDCTNLTLLDLNNFNTSNVKRMRTMFVGCSSLTTIYVGNDWSMAKVTESTYMFKDCTSLVGQNGTKYNAKYTHETYARLDTPEKPGYLSYKVALDASALKNALAAINTASGDNETFTLTFAKSYSGSATGTSVGSGINLYNDGNGTVVVAPTLAYSVIMAPSDCKNLFAGLTKLSAAAFTNFNTEDVTDMSSMFEGCSSLISLNLTKFNTTNVTDMSSMFEGCSSLNVLNLVVFKTLKVTDMSGMFKGCEKLTTICVGDAWSTANVTSSDDMCNGCTSLVGEKGTTYSAEHTNADYAHQDAEGNPGYFSINEMSLDASALMSALTDINSTYTTNETTFTITFANSYSGSAQGTSVSTKDDLINLYNDGNGNVVVAPAAEGITIVAPADCKKLFADLTKLTSITFTNYNTSGVTDMSYMFQNCSSLTSLDLSSFNTSDVTDMSYMFQNCSSLTSLNVSKFNTSNATQMHYMFAGCKKLTSLDLTGFNTPSVTDMGYMFQNCSSLTSLDLSKYNTTNVTQMHYMFDGCSKLESIAFGDHFKTAIVTNMDNMFKGCSKLTSLDLSGFNTSDVTDMGYMFQNCSSLTSLDLSKFNTTNVTQMHNMFDGCSKLKSIAFGDNFKTAIVTDMDNMFKGCSSLTSLDLSSFNTSSVKNMSYMFQNCSSLTSLDLSKFNTSSVKNMSYMFNGCSKLESIAFGDNFNTSSVTNMKYMFSNCSSLTSLDLSSFNTEKVLFMSYMFDGCKKLTLLNLSSFNTSEVRQMDYMFRSCSSLTSIDLRSFNTEKVVYMQFMFWGCTSLTSLDLSSFNTKEMWYIQQMFADCSSLATIYVSDNWSTAKVQDSNIMFYGCTNLVGQNGTTFSADHVDGAYAHVDGGNSNPGYLSSNQVTLDRDKLQTALKAINTACGDNGTFTLTFAYSYSGSATGTTVGTGINLYNDGNGNYVVAPAKEGFIIMVRGNCPNMFYGIDKLSNITFTNFNTSKMTNMMAMFFRCSSLTSLDLSGFNTSEVINMFRMFYDCSSLTTIVVGDGWTTEKVDDVRSGEMFSGCTKLKGQSGTTYAAEHTGGVYARVDAEGNPGYLTYKDFITPGDLNADGVITIADLIRLVEILNNRATDTTGAADVDGQNGVTVDDVNALRNKLLGK